MPDSAFFFASPESDPAIRVELERILRSRAFVHSHRIRRFLQFVVEEYLGGRQRRLKEYAIGLEVFGRPDSFDPRVDSIVRVEARRLRAKLDEYYAGDGGESALRIRMRKGSYVPLFETTAAARPNSAVTNPHRAWRPSITLAALVDAGADAAFAEELWRRLTHHLIGEPALRVVADGPSDYILQGRVETGNGPPRLFLQLMDVTDRAWVWSRQIECTSGDLSICEQAASSIWRAIAGSASGSQWSRPSQNGESFTSYLQGLYSCRNHQPEGFTGSIACFTRAVEADPGHAAAWAGLAEALVASSLLDRGDAPDTHARALEAAQKAVELNGALPESHLALAAVRSFFQWRWADGEKEFKRALCLDPARPGSRLLYGLQFACRGNPERARGELDEAGRLSPASLAVQFAQGWVDALEGAHEEALRRYRLIALLEPDSPWSHLGPGHVCAAQQKWPEAIAHFTNASHLPGGRFLFDGCLGYCYAKSGCRDEALDLLRRLPESAAPSVNFASIYAGFGDFQRAFACLTQAALARESCLPLLLLGPDFDVLRGEPQYRALQSLMGLGAPVASAA
jgi:tetratricopeptide (TPR) repeat protein